MTVSKQAYHPLCGSHLYAYEHGLMRLASEERATPSGLTPMEVQVLRLIVEGKTNKQIAAQMRLGASAVQSAVSSITDKIGARRPKRAT